MRHSEEKKRRDFIKRLLQQQLQLSRKEFIRKKNVTKLKRDKDKQHC